MVGQPAHYSTDLSPWTGSFLPPSLSQFEVLGVLQIGRETPLGTLYKYEMGVRIETHQVEALAQTVYCVTLG